MKQLIVGILFLSFASSCVIYEDHSYPRREVVYYDYPPYDEVSFVVFREYFMFDYYSACYARHLAIGVGIGYDTVFALSYVSYHSGVSLAVVYDHYVACGSDVALVVERYRIDPAIFFVSVGASVNVPPPYGNAYGHYRGGTLRAGKLSHADYLNLASMKIAVDYNKTPPDEFFNRVGRGEKPHEVVGRDWKNAGRGTNAGGEHVTKAERPWEMNKSSREEFHQKLKTDTKQTEKSPPKTPPGGGKGKGKGKQ